MPTLRKRNPDDGRGPGALRSSLADAAYAVEDRVVWGTADLLRGLPDVVKWPFERTAWAVENFLVWPIQEETAAWGKPARAAAAIALIALAGGAVAAGAAISTDSSGGGPAKVETLAGPAPSPPADAAHAAQPPIVHKGPQLHGTAPTFVPESGEGAPKSAESEVLSSEPSSAGAAKGESRREHGSDAAPAAGGPEVAGPAAIKVAHRFSEAFVLYEVGDKGPAIRKAFAATASPDLAKALLRRPPRLPSNVKVPKAKVLNIVVGPTHGDTYTLSVSLLRVGVTSELRLDMRRVAASNSGAPAGSAKGRSLRWQVTDVVG
jgi:hypothetical protein